MLHLGNVQPLAVWDLLDICRVLLQKQALTAHWLAWPAPQVCNLSWSKNVNELVSTHGYSQNQIIVWRYPTMQVGWVGWGLSVLGWQRGCRRTGRQAAGLQGHYTYAS